MDDLAGRTVGLAVASMYLLIDKGHAGTLLYLLSVLTLVAAPGLCFGTMELWFRYQRRQKNWLATEIEARLRDRLLPYLPPHLIAHAGPRPSDHTETA